MCVFWSVLCLCHYPLIQSKHRCSYFLSTSKIIGSHWDENSKMKQLSSEENNNNNNKVSARFLPPAASPPLWFSAGPPVEVGPFVHLIPDWDC